MKPQWKRRIKIFGLIFFLIILLGVIAFLVLEIMGKKAMLGTKDAEIEVTAPETEDVIVEESGDVVTYKGEKYVYNENITSILFMGIDKRTIENTSSKIGKSGQADMLMLAIMDVESGKVNLWNISRDAMTEVDIYNVEGEYVRTDNLQACLAYAYGDGRESSCRNVVRSVSRLLYGMPIQSYAAIDLEALPLLNDAVGGVEVTIHEGDILTADFKPGTKVLLTGEDAEKYLRTRILDWTTMGTLDSNNNRMARQKQYMTNFMHKALVQTREDITTPVKLYRIAMQDDHMVTDLTPAKITYLATVFSKVNFSENNFQKVPGEVVAGEVYAEYHVDDEALYQMILDTFYVKQ